MVSTVEPRKQTHRVISEFLDQSQIEKLILVGQEGWLRNYNSYVKSQLKGKERIAWYPNACDGGLNRLLHRSLVLVSYSLSEGFNLPILESRIAGIPVIASDIPTHRHLHGDSINYVGSEKRDLAKKLQDFSALVDPQKAAKLNETLIGSASFSLKRYYNPQS
jgi:glycosyltransferase involved in cell wall biosynthesis